jgi:hypothetical protein
MLLKRPDAGARESKAPRARSLRDRFFTPIAFDYRYGK